LRWEEVEECDPADFNVSTAPKRFAELGDAHAEMDRHAGSLEPLLELAARDESEGLADAPWPPHFRKMAGEGPRVSPSRARSGAVPALAKSAGSRGAAKKPARTRMPLLVIANSPNKEAALAGLERWKRKHRKVVKFLAPDDVLVDSMRGRSSTWTRIRVNLRNIPEDLRPPQATPDPDDDPTREWRSSKKRSAQ
jgi:bifunctional non-homologous end joining protein LigD